MVATVSLLVTHGDPSRELIVALPQNNMYDTIKPKDKIKVGWYPDGSVSVLKIKGLRPMMSSKTSKIQWSFLVFFMPVFLWLMLLFVLPNVELFRLSFFCMNGYEDRWALHYPIMLIFFKTRSTG